MVMAFVGLFGFTGLGMNTAITYYLAINHQTSDAKEIAGRLGTALCITLMGTTVFSLIFLLFFVFYAPTLQYLYPQLIAQQTLVYYALMLLIFSQCDMVISAALKGLQQYKISSQLEFIIRLTSFSVVALAAIVLKQMNLIIVLTVIFSLLSTMLRYNALKKKINIQLNHLRLNKKHANEFFHFGKWMSLQNVSSAILSSLDKLMLGFLFNATVVGSYNIIVSLSQLSHYIVASASSFILPIISASTASSTVLRSNYYKSLIISAVGTLGIILILILLYPYIKNHFNLVDIQHEYFVLLASYGVLAMCVPPYYFSLAFGKVKLLSNINTLSALAGIISIVLLVSHYGALGAALSRVAYTMVVTLTFFIPPYLFKIER